jgi:hypothetical protein
VRLHDVLSFVWLLASTGFITESKAQIATFRPMIAANGSTMCATSESTSTMSANNSMGLTLDVPPVVRCAFLCTGLNASGPGCAAINYVNNRGVDRCQFYKYQAPRCVISSSDCMYYVVNMSALLMSQ